MSFQLSIAVFGDGADENNRSHWGFMIHRVGDDFGDLMHITLLDSQGPWYQFEERSSVSLETRNAEGRIAIAVLNDVERHVAKRIISNEPGPRDQENRCQDWVLDTMIALEVEEIVESGMSDRIAKIIGKATGEIAETIGNDWIPPK